MSVGESADAPRGLAAAWRTVTLIVMGVLGVGVLVALILTLGAANRQRDRAFALQSHSYDVMILARGLSGTMARAEASLGRYVISGDEQLGRLYVKDWRHAGDQLSRLEAVTRDNSDHKPRLDRLRRAYLERGQQLSRTALSTNNGKSDQAITRYYHSRKTFSLHQINDTLDAIIDGERRLLQQRTTAAMTLVEQSTRAAFVLSSFGVLLLLGAIVLGWLTVRAITGRAKARAEADAQRARAEDLARAVAAATDELRIQEARLRQAQKMDAVGQLTGGIAHDFNNMLAVIIGGLELAERSQASDGRDVARHLASASDGAMRAAELTRRLLAFAREEAINPESIDIGTLVAGMHDLLDRTLGGGIRVDVVDQTEGARVRADRVQFENTLLNLAVNARDAMDGRGTVTISTGTQTDDAGEHVTIDVQDTGCGMTPEIAERVFEPFFTTKPADKGTGLGLSQIFAFVSQHGGDVAIDTAPGMGTTVRLRLPRDRSDAAAAPHAEAPAAMIGPSPALGILVVEDDPRVLSATTGALEELGHHAIACDDPLAVPDLLDQHPAIGLIISDVLMPERTGPEMIAALDPRHADLAVLFVTGFAGDGSEFGKYPVLRKPYTLFALEQAITQAVVRRRSAPPQRFVAN